MIYSTDYFFVNVTDARMVSCAARHICHVMGVGQCNTHSACFGQLSDDERDALSEPLVLYDVDNRIDAAVAIDEQLQHLGKRRVGIQYVSERGEEQLYLTACPRDDMENDGVEHRQCDVSSCVPELISRLLATNLVFRRCVLFDFVDVG